MNKIKHSELLQATLMCQQRQELSRWLNIIWRLDNYAMFSSATHGFLILRFQPK
jgi:hypothetical protein